MTYTSGGLIEAEDYNNIVGANTSVSSTQFNSMWAWGANSRGYGQTFVPAVTAAGLVTAAQWATLINSLNSANLHINNVNSGLTANTAGQLIGFSGSLTDKINGVITDRMTAATTSTPVVNHNNLTAFPAWTSGDTSATLTKFFGANVAFDTPDKARFFFNAGGQLKFNVSGVGSGSSRSTAAQNMCSYLGGVLTFAANTNGGRSGVGGTETVNTTVGYYDLLQSNTTIVSVNGLTTNYTTDTGTITVRTNGPQGQFNDNGTIVSFYATINSTSGANAGGSFDDSLNLTVTVTVDVTYPESINLSNTWGAVIVTQVS